jgi:hypothetical protein
MVKHIYCLDFLGYAFSPSMSIKMRYAVSRGKRNTCGVYLGSNSLFSECKDFKDAPLNPYQVY